jgi:hypothetical protein
VNWLRKLFRRVPASEVLAEQLFEAERLHVEHQAAAEVHAALAAVYRMRITRIRGAQANVLEVLRGGKA